MEDYAGKRHTGSSEKQSFYSIAINSPKELTVHQLLLT